MEVRILTTTFAIIALGATAITHAADLRYSYAELRFVETEIGNADGDGLRLNGSMRFNENWLLVGGYSTVDFDGNVDINTLEIGGGYVHQYSRNLDLIGYGKLIRAEIDTPFGDDDDLGFSLAGGARGLFTPKIEGRALLHYIDIDDSDIFFELGGDFHINRQFSAGATVEFGGDADSLTIGARWLFSD